MFFDGKFVGNKLRRACGRMGGPAGVNGDTDSSLAPMCGSFPGRGDDDAVRNTEVKAKVLKGVFV